MVQRLRKTLWRFLKELKMELELPYASAVPFLGLYLDKNNSKRYVHPYVHHSLDSHVTLASALSLGAPGLSSWEAT